MDFEEAQNKILAYLRDTPYKGSKIPNVWEVAVPAGAVLPKSRGVILPYALISFGGQSPVANRNQGIITTRNDLKWSSVAVECNGVNPVDVRKLTGIVRGLLEGYSPDPSWGELEEKLAGDYTVYKPDYELMPIRFATGIVFNTMTNATTEPQ